MYQDRTDTTINQQIANVVLMMNSSELTKDLIKQVVDDSFGKKKFQDFVQIMTHAQTCQECSKVFHETMKKAEDHLLLELV